MCSGSVEVMEGDGNRPDRQSSRKHPGGLACTVQPGRPIPPESPACQDRLDLVSYFDGTIRFAIEACRVLEKKSGTRDAGDKVGLCLRGTSGQSRLLEVSEPVELISLQAACIHPVPLFLARKCTIPGLRALAFDARGMMLLVEPL